MPAQPRRSLMRPLLMSLLLALCGCKEQLYTGLSERDANEMIAVLTAHGLQADKVATENGDFKLELDRSDFAPAVDTLRDHGLPRPKFSSIGEVFKQEGLVTTANAERLRFMYAMSEELSHTLSMIDGVVEARVQPVLPGGDPLTDKITPASASVFIKHSPNANLAVLAPQIKDLVCASIEGLSYDRVSLTFVAADALDDETAKPHDSALPLPLSCLGIGFAAGLLLLGVVLLGLRRAPLVQSTPLDAEAARDNAPPVQAAQVLPGLGWAGMRNPLVVRLPVMAREGIASAGAWWSRMRPGNAPPPARVEPSAARPPQPEQPNPGKPHRQDKQGVAR